MAINVFSDKIICSTGLRVRPFVNAICSQFVPILHTTVGVSCSLFDDVMPDEPAKVEMSRILDFTGFLVPDCPEKIICLLPEKQHLNNILNKLD